MPRCLLVVTISLALLPHAAVAQTPPADPDVRKGIRAVDEGDYDLAIFTLDAAARRLAADRSRVAELSQAYLHLGIAYVAKGHEAAAKAQFREALKGARDLSLSPERFAPRVIDLFESVRAESRPEPVPSAAARGKGSKLPLVIGGVGLAAGGAALAVSAGGGGGANPTPDPAPPPSSTAPASAPGTKTFSGNLAANENLSFPVAPSASGTLEATLSWTNTEAALAMDLHVVGAGHIAGTSNRTATTGASLTIAVAVQTYSIQVLHRGGCIASGHTCTTPFTLVVHYP